ncbi:MAG: hypothetical protein QMC67_09395 [Candidatus Wallbacteria bacterium]
MFASGALATTENAIAPTDNAKAAAVSVTTNEVASQTSNNAMATTANQTPSALNNTAVPNETKESTLNSQASTSQQNQANTANQQPAVETNNGKNGIKVPHNITGQYTGSEENLKTLLEALSVNFGEKGLTDDQIKELITSAVAQSQVHQNEMSKIYIKAIEIGTKKYDMSNRFFNPMRLNVLIAGILLLSFISYFTYHAKQGKEFFIRRIGGLSAIDEAVGRATEMGKPVLFVPGIYDMDDIQTVSAVSILGSVAKKTAEYETNLLVPCARSLVMMTSQEVVKEAYLKAGRSDSFKSDNIRYLTDDQFGYVAGVDGIMLREKPAANFYLGVFYAESLILAETGHHIGSIQIAGTAIVSQIPFFVAACDYTLIGEELFAASAYLSREPLQLGALKGQDMGKFLIIITIIAGIIFETFGYHAFSNWFLTR